MKIRIWTNVLIITITDYTFFSLIKKDKVIFNATRKQKSSESFMIKNLTKGVHEIESDGIIEVITGARVK